MNHWQKQTKQWEYDCVKTRRNAWLRRRRLGQFAIGPKDTVLDLGCGDGLDVEILKKLGIRNVVGLDISSHLLAQARKRNPGVRFVLASAERMPFADKTFDVVFADSVFHHLVNHPKALSEIWRVLKPRGRLCFVDPHRSSARRIFDWLTLSPLASIVPFLGFRRQAYLAEKDLMEHWLGSEQAFLAKLPAAGFRKDFCRADLLSVIGQYQKKPKNV